PHAHRCRTQGQGTRSSAVPGRRALMLSLRILVVDDHGEFRTLLRHHIAVKWPSAQIADYDPSVSGPLPDSFDGSDADVVLLDYQLGIDDDGFTHLRRFRRHPLFPPV